MNQHLSGICMDWYRLVFMRVLMIDSFSRTSVTKQPLGTNFGTVEYGMRKPSPVEHLVRARMPDEQQQHFAGVRRRPRCGQSLLTEFEFV
jgi:hypothetical protein